MRDFRLPDVGEGISEAEVLEWLVAPGDAVDEGQPVVEVSTDKVTTELPSPVAGTVAELAAEVGDVVEVGEVIVRFRVADEGDDTTAGDTGAGETDDGGPGATDVDARVEEPRAVADPGPRRDDDRSDDGGGRDADEPSRVRPVASPVVRRLAAERDVDLATVSGSGPGGRILRADLDRAWVGAAAGTTDEPRAAGRVERERLAGHRAVTARTMVRAASTAAMTTSTFEVDGDGILDLVERVGAGGRSVTPTAVVAACVAAALTSHPRLNAVTEEDGRVLAMHERVDLAIAVATDDGLMTPVVRDAAGLRLTELADRIASLAEAARDGELTGADLRDGTFTLSSTGGLERVRMVSTQPVLNVPQVACLWVSRIVPRPRVGPDGDLEVGPVMTCSLTFDHRFVDGAEATVFMNDLGALLAEPVRAVV